MKQNNIEGAGGIKAMNIDHDHGHEAETEKLWQESQQLEFILGLKAGKSLAEMMEQFGSAKAFAEGSKEVGCSDGRICEHRLGGAGNFILATEKEQADFIQNNRGKISLVKSHDGCGAAGIKFKQMAAAGEPMPQGVTNADELGIYFSKQLAKELGADYGHTGAEEMSGPVHNERVIYFDGTGKFNPGAMPELPAGFMCSAPALGFNPEYCEGEMATLAKIAMGNHGFGERFNKEDPLYIIVSAKDQEQLSELKKVAERIAGQFDGKVVVDGFVAE